MLNKRTKISATLILVLSSIWSFAAGSDVEILSLNSPSDLDLSGEIVCAINFGNNGNPQFGEVVFSQDQDYPNMTFTSTAEGQTSTWEGIAPNTGDFNLDKLLHGVTWRNNSGTGGRTTSINLGGLVVGTQYQLQLIFYTDHSRPMNIAVEESIFVDQYDPFVAQGSLQGKGGSIVKLSFWASDTNLNIDITPVRNDGSTASVVSGLVLTSMPEPRTFADFGSGTTTKLYAGGATWQLNWGQGPWTWTTNTGEPLLNSNVSAVLDLRTTAAANVSADLLATLPIEGTLTFTAHDERKPDVATGTMVLSGIGQNIIDINASRVLVDEGAGMFLAPFHAPGPLVVFTLEEATGVFAHIEPFGFWQLSFSGSYAIPLVPGLGLQDNILAALGGNVALIGGIGEFTLTGQYIPHETEIVSFCEYGTGASSQLGAGGAVWDLSWGKEAHQWYVCDVNPDTGIFESDFVVSSLETTTAGAPGIDDNLILSFDFGGTFKLSDYGGTTNKIPPEVVGQILGDVEGTFVADMNAANASVDEVAGTITIAFGAMLHDGPDALITVTETTGTFSEIQPVGVWEWYVSGTIVCARVPGLSIQDNIMAALGDETLLLSAEEEIVLSGSYYRSLPSE